jgi:GNAT superfamily N-acetyltransferase
MTANANGMPEPAITRAPPPGAGHRCRRELHFREATINDVPALFAVRTATRENPLTLDELRALGITEPSVRERMLGTYAGWLCEADGKVVGFSMADRKTGELWVIAILPEYEQKRIGARLMQMAEDWLWACGCPEAWLTTSIDPSLRAYGFYQKCGWSDFEIRGGLRYMKKKKPAR